MKMMYCFFILLTGTACTDPDNGAGVKADAGVAVYADTLLPVADADTQPGLPAKKIPLEKLAISGLTPHELVDYAKTLTGVPYKYASTDPSQGFDCSGFITYVFNHFNIAVPRSSVDFTNVGTPVSIQDAREGDLILFTGTNDSIRVVGHMGIVTDNTDTPRFIHSSSGKANGVVVSGLSEYYQRRFIKVIRVFEN